MNCTKMPPSSTIWSPRPEAGRDDSIGPRRDPGSQRDAAAARNCHPAGRHRQRADSRRRAAPPKPAPARHCQFLWRAWIVHPHIHLLLSSKSPGLSTATRACMTERVLGSISSGRDVAVTVPRKSWPWRCRSSPWRRVAKIWTEARIGFEHLRHHPDPRQIGYGETRRWCRPRSKFSPV